MKKLLIICLLLAVGIFLGFTHSWAQGYFSGNAGAVWLQDSDLTRYATDKLPGIRGEVSFEPGYCFTAAIGSKSSSSGLRPELEFGYRRNNLDQVRVFGNEPSDRKGKMSSTSLMGNLFYDFGKWGISPFVGVGVGFAHLELDMNNVGEENDSVIAYQVMAGIGFPVSRRVKIDVQYRFFETSDPEFDGADAEYAAHNVMVGFRVAGF